MNRLLVLRTTLAIALLFVLSSAAVAQNSNCAYTFTYPKYAFSFCVSQYGTLAMLQAPIGVDHLDPTNPIEGYVYYFSIEGNDNFFGGCQVPNLQGECFPQPASFTQPHGPGTLPLIANDGTAKTIITANPSERQVIITTAVDIGVVKGAHFTARTRGCFPTRRECNIFGHRIRAIRSEQLWRQRNYEYAKRLLREPSGRTVRLVSE
jgi:hypothetical protein